MYVHCEQVAEKDLFVDEQKMFEVLHATDKRDTVVEVMNGRHRSIALAFFNSRKEKSKL